MRARSGRYPRAVRRCPEARFAWTAVLPRGAASPGDRRHALPFAGSAQPSQGCPMQDGVMSNRRESSGRATAFDDERADEKDTSSMRTHADKLEAWEDEGGRMGRISSEVLRLLIVDNDMRAADCLEL